MQTDLKIERRDNIQLWWEHLYWLTYSLWSHWHNLSTLADQKLNCEAKNTILCSGPYRHRSRVNSILISPGSLNYIYRGNQNYCIHYIGHFSFYLVLGSFFLFLEVEVAMTSSDLYTYTSIPCGENTQRSSVQKDCRCM